MKVLPVSALFAQRKRIFMEFHLYFIEIDEEKDRKWRGIAMYGQTQLRSESQIFIGEIKGDQRWSPVIKYLIQTAVLQTKARLERHTAVNLANVLSSMTENWGLNGSHSMCT